MLLLDSQSVKTGLDLLRDAGAGRLGGGRVGLLVHPASVDAGLVHAVDVLEAAGADLRCLFGPQHGLLGHTQDNMIEWDGYRDARRDLPVHSLYGETRRPTPDMLADLDVLVVDLQDVGARYYTFVWTLLLCMVACADAGKRVVVLDRPNPLGGKAIEGGRLNMAYASFVGLAPLPARHALTIGELALYFRSFYDLDLDLEIVQMQGWEREHLFEHTGLPWVMPSPNMPTLDTALVYPGMCLLEGTSLSEGRGTTRPFEIFGAPGIDPHALCRALESTDLPGVVFRPLSFEPTFQKHAGSLCGGAQLHVIDRVAFRPVATAVRILETVRRLFPSALRWNPPPYEYEEEKLPIDILSGDARLRETLDGGRDPGELLEAWESDAIGFRAKRGAFLLYG